jgi:hypothetical protein
LTTKCLFEIWKPIPSLPEYEASSLGRIRRVPHEVSRGQGTRWYGGKAWTGAWEKTQGRYIFQFHGKTYRVARLICEAFHGPKPFPGAVCLHLDEDVKNNVPSNLKWGTQKENLNMPRFLAYASAVCRQKMAGETVAAGKKGR